MDRVPTYQDITRARAEREAAQSQLAERNALANEVQSRVTPNPVLSEYMNRRAQQGLAPRENSAGEYTMFATNVANKVPDQETYSMAMIGAASKGQVPVDAVLEDDSILPEFKESLINAIKANTANSGLGQIR